jgi:hypothetical protein
MFAVSDSAASGHLRVPASYRPLRHKMLLNLRNTNFGSPLSDLVNEKLEGAAIFRQFQQADIQKIGELIIAKTNGKTNWV